MTFVVADRIKETTITSGLGSIILNGAFSGFQTFASGIGDGNNTFYVIENKGNWEVGIGTYTASNNSLSRDTVLKSSAGNGKINLAGSSVVFCAYPSTNSVHAGPDGLVSIKGYSGILFSDALITNSGAYFNNVLSSGNLKLQPAAQSTVPLTIVRSSSGVFFHAYKDDAYDRPVTLYTDGDISPEWRLGLKSTPNNVYEAPSFGYVYGEDGKVGLVGNSSNKLDLLNTSGFYVTHQGTTLLKGTSTTGIYLSSLSNAYPALTVNGGPSLSAPIVSFNNYAGDTLSVVDAQGRIGVKTASPGYDLDVSGSGKFSLVHLTSGLLFKDGTFQDSAGKTYSAGSGLVLVDTTFHAVSTVTSGDIAALAASGLAISGWASSEFVSKNGVYDNPSWLNSISVTKLSGVVDSSNLPSYVDDVLEYANSGVFPPVGETGKIYIATDDNSSYRWSGSVYFKLTDIAGLTSTFVPYSGAISNVDLGTRTLNASSGTFVSLASNSATFVGNTSDSPGVSPLLTLRTPALDTRLWSFRIGSETADPGLFGGLFLDTISGATLVNRVTFNRQNGYVGIGTSNPTAGLHLVGFTPTLFIAGQGPSSLFKRFQVVTGSSDNSRPVSIISGQADQNNNEIWIGGNRSDAYAATIIRFYTAAALNIVTGTERARFDSAGNFGIGTNSPIYKLDVAGNLSTRNSTTPTKIDIYNTFTDASNYERGVLDWSTGSNEFRIGSQAAGTGTQRNVVLGVWDGAGTWTPRIAIQPSGGNLVYTSDIHTLQNNSGSAYVQYGFGAWWSSNSSTNLGFSNARWGTLFTTAVNTTGTITSTIGTITASTPVIDATQTWNNAAVTFTGLKANITDTASASGSLLLDLQIGGVSRVRLGKDRRFFLGQSDQYQIGFGLSTFPYLTGGFNTGDTVQDARIGFQDPTDTGNGVVVIGTNSTRGLYLCHTPVTGNHVRLFIDAMGVLAQRNSTNAQRFNLYGTYTDASNYRRLYLSSTTAGAFTLGVEGAGTGASGNTLTLPQGVVVQNSFIFKTASLPLVTFNTNGDSGQIKIGNNSGGPSANFYTTVTGNILNIEIPSNVNIFADNGLNIKNYAGSVNAQITCSTLTASGSTLTGSSATSALNIAQTWNTTGTPTALKLNITDTASNAASLLMDLQVGGTSKFTIAKSGIVNINYPGGLRIYDSGGVIGNNTVSSVLGMFGGDLYIDNNHSAGFRFRTNLSAHTNLVMYAGSNPVSAEFNTSISFGGTSARITSDGNDIIALRRTTTSQIFRIYNAFTDAANYDRGFIQWNSNVFEIGTERAGSYTTPRNVSFKINGKTVGAILSSGSFHFGDANSVNSSASAVICGSFGSANAYASAIVGGARGSTYIAGQTVIAYGGRPFNSGNYTGGVCQSYVLTLSGYTTSSAQSRMRGGTDGAIWDNGARITIRSGYTISAIVCIKGIKSDGSAKARFWRLVDITRVGNTTTMDVAEQTLGSDYNPTGACTITIQADDTNEALEILVGGIDGEVWRWTGTIYATEMAYGT